MNRAALAWTLVGLLVGLTASAQVQPSIALAPAFVSHDDARAVLDALRSELLPPEMQPGVTTDRAAQWPSWVVRRDAEIRQRLARGDEDSVVTLLLFGVSFTTQPRYSFAARAAVAPASRMTVQGVVNLPSVRARIADMVRALSTPGNNERLQFARRVIERTGVDFSSTNGARDATAFLATALERMLLEYDSFFAGGSLPSTRFRDRGLSADTALPAAYAIDRTLADLHARGVLTPGRVGRVAIIGPGLDFADKQEGLDIYPVQTIQPFAVLDSLITLGLTPPAGVRLVTMDINPRVTQHLASAVSRARAGASYVMQLPSDPSWDSGLSGYWERLGGRIGSAVAPVRPPASAGTVHLRAVAVRPDAVQALDPHDLNIVLQRPVSIPDAERFDVVIATNVLVYYDLFEQSLALANIASLLRPGGVLLTNTPLFPLPGIPMTFGGETQVILAPSANDWVQWYVRD